MRTAKWVVFGILLAAAAASAAEVKVVQQPAKITRKTFDPKNPPKEMPPLTPPHVAQCAGEPSIAVRILGEQARTAGEELSRLRVTGIEIELKLTVTVWLPRGAGKRLIDHEETHRKIHEHYYRTAAAKAREIAAPYLEETADLTGPDYKKSGDDVLSRLSNAITTKYLAATSASAAQEKFDQSTAHGTNDTPNDAAMKQAIEEAAKP